MDMIKTPYDVIANLPINRSLNEPYLPSYEQLNKDIGLTWEFLAEQFHADEKTLRRNKKSIPYRENAPKETNEKWVDSILSQCEKIVKEFAKNCDSKGQKKRGAEVRRKWDEKRTDYRQGLEVVYARDSLSARIKNGEAETSMKIFNAEQDQKIDALLEVIKPEFDKIPEDKRKKVAHCYKEYIALLQDPLIPFICVMTPEAKKHILNEMDKLTISIGEMRFMTMLKGWKCHSYAKILNYDGSKNYGGETLWNVFSRAVESNGYPLALEMAAAIKFHYIESIDNDELQIYITNQICLNFEQMDSMQKRIVMMAGHKENIIEDINQNLLKWRSVNLGSIKELEKILGLSS